MGNGIPDPEMQDTEIARKMAEMESKLTSVFTSMTLLCTVSTNMDPLTREGPAVKNFQVMCRQQFAIDEVISFLKTLFGSDESEVTAEAVAATQDIRGKAEEQAAHEVADTLSF